MFPAAGGKSNPRRLDQCGPPPIRRRDRPWSGEDHHRRPQQQDRTADRLPTWRSHQRTTARGDVEDRRQQRAGGWRKLKTT